MRLSKRQLRLLIDHGNDLSSSNLPRRDRSKPPPVKEAGKAVSSEPEEINMAWTTPVIVEVCVGMEITSYSSAEI
jgi:coenzyme PQQ precursor peptide PqqA